MYTISEQQIEYILNDIRRNGVEMEDLQLNLLDHICCIIEQNLKDGDDFESFYQKTIRQFYRKQLWEIEEETITLLTFKNYYAMKKSMIISGTISVAALLFGSFLKIMHWPGSAPMLILGIGSMSFLFLPLLFLLKTKDTGTKRDKLITGIATFVGILLCLATLFKIMHWPGASTLWITTSAVSIFALIPVYFFTGIRKAETKANTIVTTIMLVGGTGLLFTLTSLRPSTSMEQINFIATQDIVAALTYANEQNNIRYAEFLTDTTTNKKQVEELKQKSADLYMQIENIKLMLVNTMEGENEKTIDYSRLLGPNASNYDLPAFFDNNAQPEPVLIDLKKWLSSYTNFIKTNYNKNSFGLLTTSDIKSVNGTLSWEINNYYRVPIGAVVRNLTQIQLDIRVIEASCIR